MRKNVVYASLVDLERVYVGECAGSRLEECLRKEVWITGKQGEWRGFVRGKACGVARGMNP